MSAQISLLSFSIQGSGGNIDVAQIGTDIYIGVSNISGINTGDLTGAFYPRFSNPKGYITQSWLSGLACTGDVQAVSGALLALSGYLQSQIDSIESTGGSFDTGTLNSLFYPLNGNPAGFLTNLNGTGVLNNAFYPLGSNPAGYLTDLNGTGTLLNVFYPISNPAGYITGFDSSNFVLKSQTGQFVTTNQIANLVSKSETGNFVTNNQIVNLVNKSETGNFVTNNQIASFATKSYVDSASGVLNTKINNIPVINTGSLVNAFYPLNSNPAGYVSSVSGVLNVNGPTNITNGQLLIGSTIDNAFIQGDITSNGGITLVKNSGSIIVGTDNTIVKSNQTGNFVVSSQLNGYVLTSQTGNFITSSQLSSYVLTSQTGGFVTSNQLNNYVQNSQTGSFATQQYVNNAIAVVSGQGGTGTIVKVTGSANLNNVNISGLGSTKVILSGNILIISGNPSGTAFTGNFVTSTSGNITMQGGATISNGQLLIGNASTNSFDQGSISAGSGISITSGTASLIISSTVSVPSIPSPYFWDIKTKGSSFTLGSGDFTVIHTGSSAATFTLPSAVGINGRVWVVKNAASANTTVTSTSNIYTTGNSTSVIFNSGDALSFHSDGVKYYAH